MRKVKFIFLILAILSGMAYVIYAGFQKSFVYYFTVSEIVSNPPKSGTDVKVTGIVKKGSVVKDMDMVEFVITEGNKEIKVVYKGILPDAFAEENEVIAEGKFDRNSMIVKAHTLMTKCPSRYENMEANDDDKGYSEG